jgi:hypothetical protein
MGKDYVTAGTPIKSKLTSLIPVAGSCENVFEEPGRLEVRAV